MEISNLKYTEYKNIDNDSILLIPLGATEQHGPHLPAGTDYMISQRLCHDIAEYLNSSLDKGKIYTAPSFNSLLCERSTGFPGTINLKREIVKEQLENYILSFTQLNFRKIVLLTMNILLENVSLFKEIIKKLEKNTEIAIFEPFSGIHYNNIPEIDEILKNMDINPIFENHGDIKETSIMLYLHEKLVDKNYEDLTPVKINISAKNLAGAKTFKAMEANEGYLGSPGKASSKLGKKIYKIYRKKIVEAIKSILAGDEIQDLPMLLKLSLKIK